MTTTSTRVPRVTRRRRVPPSAVRRILVATAGEDTARGALRLAHALALQHHASVHVLAAAEPLPPGAMSALDLVPAPDVDETNRQEVLAAAKSQVAKLGGHWPVRAVLDEPARAIVGEADRLRASVIVVGLGRHKRIERLLGQDNTMAVIRHARVPVLAVPEGASEVPMHAVVAMDFTDASVAAARLAAALVPRESRLTLVHVPPFAEFDRRDGVNWLDIYATGAETRLAALRDELRAATRREVDVAMLHGDPADAVLRFAKRERADLIALGVHSQTAVERMLIGSTTTRVLRGATCSVLVAPQSRSD